jgi:hypothetical protein
LEHFKSGLFGFTGDLFCTFCTLSHPTYENQTGPYATYKLKHFKSGLFGFTGDLFCTFCTLSHTAYGTKRDLNFRDQKLL